MNYQSINLFTLLIFFSATLSAMDAPDLGQRLIDAIKAGDLERARVLIARGAPVNLAPYQERDGFYSDFKLSALQWAAKNGNVGAIRMLIAAGATQDIQVVPYGAHVAFITGTEADKAYREKTALMYAAGKGHLACVQELIAAGTNVNIRDYCGDTALSCAAGKGNLACVRELIAAGAHVNNLSEYQNTPLSLAARNGHLACIRELIDAGAQVNASNQGNSKSPLIGALDGYHEACVCELIAAGAEIHHSSENGRSMLDIAVGRSNAACVHELVAAGADVNYADVNYAKAEGATLLMRAVFRDNSAMVRELVAGRARLMVRDAKGNAALHYAAHFGRKEICEILIEALLTLPNDRQKSSIITLLGVLKLRTSQFKELYRQRADLFRSCFGTAIYDQNQNNFGDSVAGQELANLPDHPFKKTLLKKYKNPSAFAMCSLQ